METITSVKFKKQNGSNRTMEINGREFMISENLLNMVARCSNGYQAVKTESEIRGERLVQLEAKARAYDELSASLVKMIEKIEE